MSIFLKCLVKHLAKKKGGCSVVSFSAFSCFFPLAQVSQGIERRSCYNVCNWVGVTRSSLPQTTVLSPSHWRLCQKELPKDSSEVSLFETCFLPLFFFMHPPYNLRGNAFSRGCLILPCFFYFFKKILFVYS